MTGPFVRKSDEVGDAIAGLATVAQVRMFSCVSLAFLPAVRRWEKATRSGREIEEQLTAAAAFCMAYDGRDASRLADLAAVFASEAQGPQDGPESDHGDFITAHDAWICGGIAADLLRGSHSAREGAWYILEPRFQDTSERLFGVSDVGSEDEDTGESTALADPALVAAVSSIRAGVALLTTSEGPDWSPRQLTDILGPLCP
jgi:hypothetical protein